MSLLVNYFLIYTFHPTMKLFKILFRYWESIVISIIILYLSFASPSTFKGVPSFEYEDKLVHLCLYAGLTAVLIYDFRKFAKRNYTNTLGFVIVCMIFPVFLGGAVEILQPMYFAPRTAEWFDWFSDIAGMLAGLATMSVVKLPRSFYTVKAE